MSEPTGPAPMPPGAQLANDGLTAVAEQVTLQLLSLQQLGEQYRTAVVSSQDDRAGLHRQADELAASVTAFGKALAALVARQPRSALAAQVPAVTTVVGTAAVEVKLTWAAPWPDDAYQPIAWVETSASLLGKTACTVKSKSREGCVVTVSTTAVLAAGAATLRAISVST